MSTECNVIQQLHQAIIKATSFQAEAVAVAEFATKDAGGSLNH